MWWFNLKECTINWLAKNNGPERPSNLRKRERERERATIKEHNLKKTLAENNNIVSLRRAVLLLCNANQEEEEKTSDTHTDTKRHTHNQKIGQFHRPKSSNEMLAQLNLKTELFPPKTHTSTHPTPWFRFRCDANLMLNLRGGRFSLGLGALWGDWTGEDVTRRPFFLYKVRDLFWSSVVAG